MNDTIKVDMVVLSYLRVLRSKFNKNYVKLSKPRPGTATWNNCLEFFNLAVIDKRSVLEAMSVAMSRYSSDWCFQTFRRSYPPFTLCVSEKSRNHVLATLPLPLQHVEQDYGKLAGVYIKLLEGLDESTALELVTAGAVTGNDDKLKAALLHAIRAGHATA